MCQAPGDQRHSSSFVLCYLGVETPALGSWGRLMEPSAAGRPEGEGSMLEEDLKKALPTSKTLGKCLIVTEVLPLLESGCCWLKSCHRELVTRPHGCQSMPSPLNNTWGTCIYPRTIPLHIS